MKLDLHIHTKRNRYLDSDFTFSEDMFRIYVEENRIDVAAITNHNFFDENNFNAAKTALSATNCLLLPGIEISLENGHVLVILNDDLDNISLLKTISSYISVRESNDHYQMTVDEFNNLCCGHGALIIPHYDKKPRISKAIIQRISDHVFAGEVSSAKGFYELKKLANELTPVLFSDIRIGLSTNIDDYKNKSRFTYINSDDISFKSIVKALQSNSVVVTQSDLPDTFDILNGTCLASTGINVLIGKRSSGKTYTLDHICEHDSNNCLYIKQFEISKECDDDKFKQYVLNDDKKIVNDFVFELNKAFDILDNSKSDDLNIELNDYVNSLNECANNIIADIYSKCALYNYVETTIVSDLEPRAIIKSFDTILDSSDIYKKIISKKIKLISLIESRNTFMQILKKIKKKNYVIDLSNSICKTISKQLGQKSTAKQLDYFDLSKYLKLLAQKRKFNKLIDSLDNTNIETKPIFDKFSKQTILRRQKDKRSWKSLLKVPPSYSIDYLCDLSPADGYLKYHSDEDIRDKLVGDDRYMVFFNYDTIVVNSYGQNVSGGQKAEYLLLHRLSNYKNYDTILIDEMESSFDNPFLNTEVIKKIKLIAKTATVFVSTHNNNLGVSLEPDFYIYHLMDETRMEHLQYCGPSNNEFLTCEKTGEKIPLSKALIDTMEASESAYTLRKKSYEIN